MNFINLIPHVINVVGTFGAVVASFEPSGSSARCVPAPTLIRVEGEIPLYETKIGPLTGLPEPKDGTYYITSHAAKQAAQAQGRIDRNYHRPMCMGPRLPAPIHEHCGW